MLVRLSTEGTGGTEGRTYPDLIDNVDTVVFILVTWVRRRPPQDLCIITWTYMTTESSRGCAFETDEMNTTDMNKSMVSGLQ